MSELPLLPDGSLITIGEKYRPAMEITDPFIAGVYFERCVRHCMSFGVEREKAEQTERANLGYYAGYYSSETRARVEQIFMCAHPIFGALSENRPQNIQQAIDAGMLAAREAKP